MKANELRMGNWVGMNLKELPENHLSVLEVGETMKCDDNGNPGFWHIDEFEPIPLSDIILINCGFTEAKTSHEGVLGYDYGGIRVYLNPCTIHWNAGNDWFPRIAKAQYLHQLQNLYYCLTGTELDVKL